MKVKAGVEEAKKLIQQAADLLPIMKKTISLGIQPETQSNASETDRPKQAGILQALSLCTE